MPRLALVIAITISMLSATQRDLPSVVGARTFVSLEGRFSILLPDHNGFGPLSVPTPFGNANGQMYQWETKEATFAVGFADAVRPLQDAETIKQFFSLATDRFNQAATANSGNIAPVKQLTLDKYPGIEQRVDLFTGAVIQRTYIVSPRIYEMVAVLKNNQRVYESVAIGTLNSFKLISEAEVTAKRSEEAAAAEPSPLPQKPVTPREGSDATDDGLHGRVKSVLTESEDLSGTWAVQGRKRNSFDTFNEHGDKLRTESYDYRGNLDRITVYGYIDGGRVATSKTIEHEYNPPPISVALGPSPEGVVKKPDPRYQNRFEFKYDQKKRLTEKTWFRSNGEVSLRYVYKYNGNQKEEFVYAEDGSLNQRYSYLLDDKGNVLERAYFEGDKSTGSKSSFTYEFDAKGNWTKRTTSRIVKKDGREQVVHYSVDFRTITYY